MKIDADYIVDLTMNQNVYYWASIEVAKKTDSNSYSSKMGDYGGNISKATVTVTNSQISVKGYQGGYPSGNCYINITTTASCLLEIYESGTVREVSLDSNSTYTLSTKISPRLFVLVYIK